MYKNEKTSSFLKAIDKYARKQQSEISEEIREIEKREMEKAEADIMEDVRGMIQKELANMKNRILIEVSHKELEERKRVSNKRRDIFKSIFMACRDRLKEFTAGSEYEYLLKNCSARISKVLVEDDTVLFVRKEDIKYSKIIKESFGRECEVKSSGGIIIGGIRGYSEKMGLIADETLDERLNSQKDWFAAKYGVTLV